MVGHRQGLTVLTKSQQGLRLQTHGHGVAVINLKALVGHRQGLTVLTKSEQSLRLQTHGDDVARISFKLSIRSVQSFTIFFKPNEGLSFQPQSDRIVRIQVELLFGGDQSFIMTAKPDKGLGLLAQKIFVLGELGKGLHAFLEGPLILARFEQRSNLIRPLPGIRLDFSTRSSSFQNIPAVQIRAHEAGGQNRN